MTFDTCHMMTYITCYIMWHHDIPCVTYHMTYRIPHVMHHNIIYNISCVLYSITYQPWHIHLIPQPIWTMRAACQVLFHIISLTVYHMPYTMLCHAAPRHATPRYATPCHAMPCNAICYVIRLIAWAWSTSWYLVVRTSRASSAAADQPSIQPLWGGSIEPKLVFYEGGNRASV